MSVTGTASGPLIVSVDFDLERAVVCLQPQCQEADDWNSRSG
ncbi:hypothetical protein [Kribbella sp. NPDC004536]